MEYIRKGEVAKQSGMILNNGEREAYVKYLEKIPEFIEFLDYKEKHKYNTWDWVCYVYCNGKNWRNIGGV